MRPFKKSRALLILSVVLLLAIAALLFLRLRTQNIQARSTLPHNSRMNAFPKVFLWAWERPEQLEF
ncbi:MAG: hypothetical protein ICV68_12340, partial [Pyrinomonadaceae bacterium]|nr:hypothetical protein [Pyrinomonadaceae bacterium]